MLCCSSGVLLSPQMSAGLDGLGASTVLVSKADTLAANSIANTPTKLKQGASEADGDWQVL